MATFGRMTEEELVKGCQRGDNTARKTLYECFGGRMLGLCIRYVGSREQAEDLLHDGFLKIFKSIEKFRWRGDGSLLAWIYRLFVNESLDYVRKAKLFPTEDTLEQDNILDEYPEESSIPDLTTDELLRLISELPIGFRTVLNLYLFEDKSHKEIGELLHITDRTSASQYCRAKVLLKKKIDEYLKCKRQ